MQLSPLHYKTVHKILEQLENEELQTLAQAGQSESAMIAYDNFEQVESIKFQRLNDNNIFHSVTTEELIKDAHIPADDLMQNMLENASLTLNQALHNAGNCLDEIELQVCSVSFCKSLRGSLVKSSINLICRCIANMCLSQ